MARAIGIDLGTTYSAAAVINQLGKPEILTNREGDRLTPSVILLQDGLTLVGAQAKNAAATAPSDIAQYVKRFMGDPSWSFVAGTGDRYTPEMLSAIILKRLAEDAALALDDDVASVVITVPAYFDDARRKATRDAGAIAGLDVLHVLNEPTAAALAYGLDRPDAGKILVYDLGGGTLDVTLMDVQDGLFDVLATDGDRELGGQQWDDAILTYFCEQVRAQGGPDLMDDDELLIQLRERAENAKRALTTTAKTKMFATVDGRNFAVDLTREMFDDLTAPLLRRTQSYMEAVVEEAGLAWDQIDTVLLAGGSTRMPSVGRMVQRVTGKALDRSVNPDEVVALGAAVQAHLLAEKEAKPGESRLPVLSTAHSQPIDISDVTSHGIGVLALNEHGVMRNTLVLPQNTKVMRPVSEVFTTTRDGQTQIDVQVTVGNDEDPDYVSVVHTEPLAIPPYPAGAPIEVVMSYDIDGMVHVQVRDLTTNTLLGEIELERPNNLDASEISHLREVIAGAEIS